MIRFDAVRWSVPCFLVLAIATGLGAVGSALANETNTVPKQWSWEGVAPETEVVDQNSVGSFGWEGVPHSPTNPAAVVLAESYTPPSSYPITNTTHTQVLDVLGTISNTFVGESGTRTNIWVDAMVQAGRLSAAPSAPNDAQVAAYFNSNGQVVVKHRYYESWAPTDRWTELAHSTVASDAWTRVTFKMNYLDVQYQEDEHFFEIRLNGGTAITSAWAYSDPNNIIVSAPDGGTWFMCADSGSGSTRPNNKYFTGMAFDGAGKVDDVVVTGELGFVPTTTTSTTTTTAPGGVKITAEPVGDTFRLSWDNGTAPTVTVWWTDNLLDGWTNTQTDVGTGGTWDDPDTSSSNRFYRFQ